MRQPQRSNGSRSILLWDLVQTHMLAISKLVSLMVHEKQRLQCMSTLMILQNFHSGHAGFGGR